jgi:undecaprenyl-diphosphatase
MFPRPSLTKNINQSWLSFCFSNSKTSQMNLFDYKIIKIINFLAKKSPLLDSIFIIISQNHLIKASVLVAILWLLWFRKEESNQLIRQKLIALMVGCIAAMFGSRLLSLTLPLRLRPLHEADLGFILPSGMSGTELDGWSSFPSDHAALFFALSFGFFFVDRFWGILAMSYTLFVICFTRVYLGLHYPTDILGGIATGAFFAWLAQVLVARTRFVMRMATWPDSQPSLFYPALFIITYQFADMFMSGRQLLYWVAKLLSA